MGAVRSGTAFGEADAEDHREVGSSASRAGPGRLVERDDAAGGSTRRVRLSAYSAFYEISLLLPSCAFLANAVHCGCTYTSTY